MLALLLLLPGLVAGQCDSLPGGDECPPTGIENFADPSDCTMYYACTDGCARRSKCERDFLFDTVYGYCNYPLDVDCSDRPCSDPSHCLTTPPTSPPTTTTPDCSGHDPFSCRHLDDGWYSDPYNCRRYWHCSERLGEKFYCEDNLVYDEENVWCDYPENVNCGSRPVCDECDQNCFQPSTPAPTTPDCGHAFDCSDKPDGFYADPFNCAKYWQCSGGLGQHNICDDDLLYDPVHIWCDYPEYVSCGDRPICNDPCDQDCSPQRS